MKACSISALVEALLSSDEKELATADRPIHRLQVQTLLRGKGSPLLGRSVNFHLGKGSPLLSKNIASGDLRERRRLIGKKPIYS